MLLAASFFLRIFIYGLVGFVPRGDEVAVLLVRDQHHAAFVGFEASACHPHCPMVTLDAETPAFPGLKLDGYEIQLSPVTEGTGSPTFKRSEATDKIPAHQDKAVLLDWLPGMASILGNPRMARIKKDCLRDDAASCAGLLAGRVRFRNGVFNTCRLVQHWNSTSIYSYEFKGFVLGPDRREHALAEIVNVAFRQEGTPPSSVALVLRDLGTQATVRSINLNTSLCSAAGDRCLDIFVGNMPPKDCDDSHRVGNHFTLLYKLLEEEPEAELRPYKNFFRQKEAGVQPQCERVLPRGVICPTGNKKGKREVRSPESRSVCPMVVLDPP